MSLICWMSIRPSRFESQRFGILSALFKKHGMSIYWVQIPDTKTNQAEPQLEKWCQEVILPDTKNIFFSDKDSDLLKKVISSIKANANIPPLPIFWVYTEVDLHLVERMTQTGIDDFFHVSQNPHDILSRMKLRTAQTQKLTHPKMAEVKAQNTKSEIALLQREEFLNVCAHDLRSPLGLIQSSLSLVLESKTLNPSEIDLLTRAKRQSTQAIALVNDLLDVMSLEQGLKPVYQLFNLHDFLNEIFEDYKAQAAEKKITLSYSNTIKNWRVLADPERIRQVLQNLIVNAIKFTPEDKNIAIKVSSFIGRRKTDPPYPMIIVNIKDEGMGIPPQELQKIFDKFSQIKDYSRADGRGLGLTVAKQITTLHNGNVWVESEKGKGSNFSVLLPYAISRLEPSQKTENQNLVLIAEPSLDKRERYFRQLEAWGYELEFVKDGVEALAMLFHKTPAIFIFNPDLSKLGSIELFNIAKSELITSKTLLLASIEEGLNLDATKQNVFARNILKLPLSKASFQDTIFRVKNLWNEKLKKAA
jgi:signal transduction histidine kinase